MASLPDDARVVGVDPRLPARVGAAPVDRCWFAVWKKRKRRFSRRERTPEASCSRVPSVAFRRPCGLPTNWRLSRLCRCEFPSSFDATFVALLSWMKMTWKRPRSRSFCHPIAENQRRSRCRRRQRRPTYPEWSTPAVAAMAWKKKTYRRGIRSMNRSCEKVEAGNCHQERVGD